MTATLRPDETFRLTVTAASPAAPLAIDLIAGKLGIEPARVARQLASLPAVLAEALADREARRLAALLALVGFQVRLDPVLSPAPADDPVDLALHPLPGGDRGAALHWLARVLPGADPAQLDRAGGLLLPALAAAERGRIVRALRRKAGLRITLSSPATAVYDLFAPRTAGLAAEVARLGLAPCRFSGAAAGGLNRATGRVLVGRIGPGAMLLDRAFQRFDLLLRAAPGLSAGDLAAFLAARSGGAAPGAAARLDTDLSRAAAERFVADYAAIGIEARAELRGERVKNR